MLKAIIFDMDGVLLDSMNANAEYFRIIFKQLSIKYKKEDYIRRNHLTMWDIIKFFSKQKDENKIKKILEFGLSKPYPFRLVKIPKNAKKIITVLSKSFKLGIVTARQKKGVEPVLKKYGYFPFMTAIVKFGDYKKPKPNPEPLLLALKKLKVKPHEAIYVGDMRADILCAKAAGVKSVLYRNKYSDVEKGDYTISSFKQLLKIAHAK